MTQRTATREEPMDQMVVMDPERVALNPWNTRTHYEREDLDRMKESLLRWDLLQMPTARYLDVPGEPQRFEVAFGGKRVTALKELIAEGKWHRGIPLIIKTLSDEEMALMAIAENGQRSDVPPIEEYRSWKRSLDEIEGLTIAKIAEARGLHPSTVSTALRLLDLPAEVLDRVTPERLGLHAAREFLALVGTDHAHLEEIRWVLARIEEVPAGAGTPDYRIQHVRTLIRAAVGRPGISWRPLFRNDVGEGPAFDVQAFMSDHFDRVHNIPGQGEVRRPWTCNVAEWVRQDAAAAQAARKAPAVSPPKGDGALPREEPPAPTASLPAEDPAADPESPAPAPEAAAPEPAAPAADIPGPAPEAAPAPVPMAREPERPAPAPAAAEPAPRPASATAVAPAPAVGSAERFPHLRRFATDPRLAPDAVIRQDVGRLLDLLDQGSREKAPPAPATGPARTIDAWLQESAAQAVDGGLKVVLTVRGSGVMVAVGRDDRDPVLRPVAGTLRQVLLRVPEIVEEVGQQWVERPRNPQAPPAPAAEPKAKTAAPAAKKRGARPAAQAASEEPETPITGTAGDLPLLGSPRLVWKRTPKPARLPWTQGGDRWTWQLWGSGLQSLRSWSQWWCK